MSEKKNRFLLPAFLALVFLMFVLLHDLFGGTFLASSSYNSYTLQARAWLEGRLDIGKDIPWLELAVYGGRYYVSFPPVPTFILLPFAAVFGEQTPDHLIIALMCLAMVALAYGIFRKTGCSVRHSLFWSAFSVLGSNMLWMCTDGSVWFFAQAANMCFCLAAVLLALSDKRALSFFAAALAVGCRPFSVLLFVPLLVMFYKKERPLPGNTAFGTLLRLIPPLIPAAIVAAAYMWFNYARFGSPFVFGHRYLPEFTKQAQFSVSYIWGNIKNLLRPVGFTRFLRPDYPIYDGFLLFAANPVFVLLFTRFRKPDLTTLSAFTAMLLELVLLTMHRTLGGWQFGARYTVDLIPLALFAMLPSFKEKAPRGWEMMLCGFAVLFNLYGALAMHFLYA